MLHRFKTPCFLLFALASLSACVVNPVTGKKELSLVSANQEVAIGEQQYTPTRQMQGGDYVLDSQLTRYVNTVGQKLASVSGRPGLPYEFTVLNNSAPNAWALPGGKIAINRGLLTELNSEAELAAVLGHEVVHAAARHSAKSMQRSMLLQAALLGVQLSSSDNQYAGLMVGSAQVGAQLLSQKYSRDAELESDKYGIEYMAKAGYNPQAAVDLQKTFVRLSEGQQQDWLSGLFASHPPSQERVQANQMLATKIGNVGTMGQDIYATRLATLKSQQPAYDKYDEAVLAFNQKRTSDALSLVNSAIAKVPAEAKFHSLKGDIALSKDHYRDAEALYTKALGLNRHLFQTYLGRGLARERLGELEGAEQDLARSVNLLPTATAHYSLGNIASANGQVDQALNHYQVASEARNTPVGQDALGKLVRLELPRSPDKYVLASVQLDAERKPMIIIQNRAPMGVHNIVIELKQNIGSGLTSASQQLRLSRPVPGGQTVQVKTGLAAVPVDSKVSLSARVVSASVAN